MQQVVKHSSLFLLLTKEPGDLQTPLHMGAEKQNLHRFLHDLKLLPYFGHVMNQLQSVKAQMSLQADEQQFSPEGARTNKGFLSPSPAAGKEFLFKSLIQKLNSNSIKVSLHVGHAFLDVNH